MKNFIFATVLLFFLGCSFSHNDQKAETGHATEEHAAESHEGHEHESSEMLSLTGYSENLELFLEFSPLIQGDEAEIIAYLTTLTNFKPCCQGQLSAELLNGSTAPLKAESHSDAPGVYHFHLTPDRAGSHTLVFSYRTPNGNQFFEFRNVMVYAGHEAAEADHHPAENLVRFTKELAWKTDFATQIVTPGIFRHSRHTSGELQLAPGSSQIIAATADGIISFPKSGLTPGMKIYNSMLLLTLSGRELAGNSPEQEYQNRLSDYTASRENYSRAHQLVRESIISRREFLETRCQYQQDSTAFALFQKNFSADKILVKAPGPGVLAEVLIENGQFVTAGTPLLQIISAGKLRLMVNWPVADFSQAERITSLLVKVQGVNKPFQLTDAAGALIAIEQQITPGAPFIPLYFKIDTDSRFIPGTYAEVWLSLADEENALIIPKSALLEQQGAFHVYIQQSGEYYEKRRVYPDSDDGEFVRIASGLTDGERLVIRGALDIKLASLSSGLTAHNHNH